MTLAFVLSLLKTWVDFFHDVMEGDGTLRNLKRNSIDFALKINFALHPSFMYVSEMLFS